MLASRRFLSCRLDLSRLSTAVPLIDIVGVKLILPNSLKFYVFVIYIPPSTSFIDFSAFFEILSSLECLNEGVASLLIGDFNVPSYCSSNSTRERVQLDVFGGFHNMNQYNAVANRDNRLLDLVFSSVFSTEVRYEDPIVAEDPCHPTLEVLFELSVEERSRFIPSERIPTYNFRPRISEKFKLG